jgi:hypothetical protein
VFGAQPLQPLVRAGVGGFLDDQQNSAVRAKRHHLGGDERVGGGLPLQ